MSELEAKVDISKMVIAVAINKADLPDKQISEADLEELKEITDFSVHETSAKTGEGVNEMFSSIGHTLIKRGL